MTPAHRFPETETDSQTIAKEVFERLKEQERNSDVKSAQSNQRGKRKESGASIRADVREVALSLEQITESFGSDNKKRASAIRKLEREIKERHEKNISAYISLGKKLREFQIQAEYTKEGKTLVNDTRLNEVLTANGLEHFTNTVRRPYIVIYQRESELEALEAWRNETAKKRIKPLHELDADSIRSAFDKFDKSQNASESNETDSSETDSSDNGKKDSLEKLLANIVTRANALGIEKKTLIAELNKREF